MSVWVEEWEECEVSGEGREWKRSGRTWRREGPITHKYELLKQNIKHICFTYKLTWEIIKT
jgi:hypothetical protein